MKRILFLLLFLPTLLSAQIGNYHLHDSATSKAEAMLGAIKVQGNWTRDGSKAFYRPEKLEKPHIFGAPRALYYNKLYYLGEISDSSAIFSHTRGIYLGEYVQERNKPTFIRNGFGIDRIMDDSSIDDIVKYEYYIGFFKKNKRHGDGFLVRENGTVVKASWKKGRMILRTKVVAVPEEEEKIRDYVRQLNNLM